MIDFRARVGRLMDRAGEAFLRRYGARLERRLIAAGILEIRCDRMPVVDGRPTFSRRVLLGSFSLRPDTIADRRYRIAERRRMANIARMQERGG